MEPLTADDFNESGNPAEVVQRPFPRLAAELAPITGRLKTEPGDFDVEEIPAYLPSGEGEHLFLWIEKEDVAAEQLTRHVARTFNLPVGDVGVAGLKDRRAVTRQWISVPARLAEGVGVESLNTAQIRVLSSARHNNKLRTGHLKGNRFSILLRETEAEALPRALAIAERISTAGFPNYYGSQRYGAEGNTLDLGWQLLRGTKTPRDIPGSRRKFLLRLALSSVQSSLFDQSLADRIDDGLFARVLEGDVMQVVASGGVFVTEDAVTDQQRLDAGEIAITGPMFGPKMRGPTGVAAEREAKVLDANQVLPDAFTKFSQLTSGTRRPYSIKPADLTITEDPNGLRFQFTLPPGTYATTLLREFLQPADNR